MFQRPSPDSLTCLSRPDPADQQLTVERKLRPLILDSA
jgi:hypothetical protein